MLKEMEALTSEGVGILCGAAYMQFEYNYIITRIHMCSIAEY